MLANVTHSCKFHVSENSKWGRKDTIPVGLEIANSQGLAMSLGGRLQRQASLPGNPETPEGDPPAPCPWGSEPAGIRE